MTLAKFLLARIAEDEEHARAPYRHWSECPLPGGGECTCTESLRSRNQRALVECEAKRRIVFTAHHAGRVARDIGQRDRPYLDILGLLALPYRDHSDYQSEWTV